MQQPDLIRLRLLGRLTLAFANDPTPIKLSTRKAGTLLAFLAVSPEQIATREQLATLLWGDCSDQQARQSLRQSLVRLRKELGRPDYISADSAVVRLQPGLWQVDALDFEQLSKSADADELARAATLFDGEFLAGLNLEEEGFGDWVREQRQRAQFAAFRLCETFAARPDLVRDGEKAIAVTERLLALDPLREDWQRIALTLYARYRGRNEALAQADVFASILQRELAVKPEPETRHLVERIRAGDIAPVRMREAALPADPNPVGPVPAVADDGDVATLAPPQAIQGRRSSIRALAATVVGAALLGAGVLGYALLPRDAAAPATAQPPAASTTPDYWRDPSQTVETAAKDIIPIAVLPIAALGDTGGATQLIADMMTDDLVNVLSRVPSFRVISRQTTSRYQGQPIDVAAIGAELRVRYVLEGSARMQDGGLRVNVQLFDPRTRLPVWSGRVERDGADRHAIRDEIVSRIARELQIDMLPIEGARRAADNSADGSAYLGWAAMQAAFAKTSVDHYRQAEAHFREALERDPGHIVATMGMGSYHANLAVQRLDADTQKHFAKAEELLGEAVRRDPRNANAHHHLGVLYQGLPGRLQEGLDRFQKAVELNPSSAGSHAHIGHALARMGQAEKGIQHIHYAMRLSPKDPALAIWHEFTGNAQLELARYPEAIESFRQSATLAPKYPRPWAGLAAAYALTGDEDGAKASLARLETFAAGLNAKQVIERFGRKKESRLHEGLRLALAPKQDTWLSPPLPSERRDPDAAKSARTITAIAVTPFKTFGGTAAAPISDTITDDLTNILSRVPQLRVISRQTMRHYVEQDYDAAKLGAELGVHYVLEGSIRPHGDRLRVNVELIDPASRLTVWTVRIERQNGEQHDIQDEIVARIARELHVEIIKADSDRISADPGIFDLTRLGWRAVFEHGTEGMPALARAEAAFSEVLKRSPGHWGGRAGLGAYHALIGSSRFVADWEDHLNKGEQLLVQSIQERPNEAGPYFYLSLIQRRRGQFAEATRSLERCVEITPSAANCYAHLGHTSVQLGRAEEGLKLINYALRLSPRDMTRSYWQRFAADGEIELGNYDKALDLLRESHAGNPTQPLMLRSLAAAYALSGNIVDAQKTLAELKAVAPFMSPERMINRPPPFDTIQPALNRGLRMAVAPRT